MLQPTPSALDKILFSPTARIYNLRLLLLVTIGLIPTAVLSIRNPGNANAPFETFYNDSGPVLVLVSSSLILLHHIVRLSRKILNAVCDWSFILIEICMVAYLLGVSDYIWHFISSGVNFMLIAASLQLSTLILSQIWTTATLTKNPQKLTLQRVDFLGGCQQCECYTIARILLNRSVDRPLVRGECATIAIVRGITLNTWCLLFPAVALYNVILSPLNSKVFTREIYASTGNPPKYEVDFLFLAVWGLDNTTDVFATRGLCQKDNKGPATADTAIPPGYLPTLWLCNGFHYDFDSLGQSLDFTFSNLTSTVYVQIGQAESFDDILLYTDPIALFPGGHLSTTLTWTQYQVISSGLPLLLGSFASLRTFLIAELHSIQPDPQYNGAPASHFNSTLAVVQMRADPVKFVQEYTESSAIGGLATVGGLWTFVNGVFALCFGANILYFLFGRRPLSALGIVHVFQRRRLLKQWHEDFPALRREGGSPQSKNAGIVAFLRERLVDIEAGEDSDTEARDQPSNTGCDVLKNTQGRSHDDGAGKMADEDITSAHIDRTRRWRNTAIVKGGYLLEENPLMDRDLENGRDRNLD